MMPQWDFLDFLRDEAAAFPSFTLRMNASVEGLVESGGRVCGVTLADGSRLHAGKLVIMADGRASPVRDRLPVRALGAPIDVFWFRLPRDPADSEGLLGLFDAGRIMVLIGRGDYWQCAYLFPKGAAEAIRARGIAAFRAEIEAIVPQLGPLDQALDSMDRVFLLSVALDRLERWFEPGLLAIGDAAHAMSPIGGIGINLAIQDAVAAANALAEPILRGMNPDALLHKVQGRRMFPTRVIQAGQKLAQDRIIGTLLRRTQPLSRVPLPLRLLNRFALLRRIPGRIIGLGVRRERVRSPKR
jgi:2-polyprenyl-6-methoxyphenol hydroxylase-like FAD-dependent oxidoreductase